MSKSGFLGSMNLARWIMLVGGVGVLGAGATAWQLHTQRAELDAALVEEGLVETTSNHIQYLGKLCTKLQADADREGLSEGKSELSDYIRDLAKDGKVKLGSVDITSMTPQVVYAGTQDIQHNVKPQTEKAARDKIMNYLYLLEEQSRRVKVTQITMNPDQKQLKEWEVGNDLWKWQIEVTERIRYEKPDATTK